MTVLTPEIPLPAYAERSCCPSSSTVACRRSSTSTSAADRGAGLPDLPARQYWTIGQTAHDCEQVVLAVQQMFTRHRRGAAGDHPVQRTARADLHRRGGALRAGLDNRGKPPEAEAIEIASVHPVIDMEIMLDLASYFDPFMHRCGGQRRPDRGVGRFPRSDRHLHRHPLMSLRDPPPGGRQAAVRQGVLPGHDPDLPRPAPSRRAVPATAQGAGRQGHRADSRPSIDAGPACRAAVSGGSRSRATPLRLLPPPGTKPHIIEGSLKFRSGGRMVHTRVVHHPGTAPNPFLRNALPVFMRVHETGWFTALRPGWRAFVITVRGYPTLHIV